MREFKKLLEIMACPVCKCSVTLQKKKLICSKCGREYDLIEGIPIMLTESTDPKTESVEYKINKN